MINLSKTSLSIAATATLAMVVIGACGNDDKPAPSEGGPGSGGASSGGTSSSGGGSAAASGGASGGGASSGGTSSGGAASGGAASGGASGSGGAGTGGSSGKLACVAPTKNASTGNTCPGAAPPALELTQVVTGLNAPVYVTQAPGDTERLYVVEQQSGLVRTVKNGAIEPTPFLNIKSVLGGPGASGEQGFLGLAFDPLYETSRRFFIKYSGTTGLGKHVIAEYKVGDDGVADPTSARVILEFNHLNGGGNHNGGMVEIGPDGCLYIAVGDGGGANDPPNTGQNPGDLFGSILRVDVDNYPTAAPGNMGGSANPHVWNYGLRNPWRFSFDKANGDMYIGDVGQGAWEEVDVEPKGTAGRNYGWKVMEGAHCTGNAASCDQSGKTLPAAEYVNPPGPNSSASMTGGYVYRGTRIPGMVGRYIYADTYTRKISSFVFKGETNGQPEVCDAAELTDLTTAGGVLVSFGQDLAGELYVVTQNPGTIYRIDPAN